LSLKKDLSAKTLKQTHFSAHVSRLLALDSSQITEFSSIKITQKSPVSQTRTHVPLYTTSFQKTAQKFYKMNKIIDFFSFFVTE